MQLENNYQNHTSLGWQQLSIQE